MGEDVESLLSKAQIVVGRMTPVYLPAGMDREAVAEELERRLRTAWYRDPVPGWVVVAMCVPLSLAMLIVLVCVTNGLM